LRKTTTSGKVVLAMLPCSVPEDLAAAGFDAGYLASGPGARLPGAGLLPCCARRSEEADKMLAAACVQ
jgi:hypothetical protein